MMKWVVIFTAFLLAAVVFGFSGVALSAAGVTKILFCLFLIMFVASLLIGLLDGKDFERE